MIRWCKFLASMFGLEVKVPFRHRQENERERAIGPGYLVSVNLVPTSLGVMLVPN